MATTAGPSNPSSPLPSTASTLWAHLLQDQRGPSRGAQIPAFAQLTPQDKASTSTRILLHDTHARLEKFSERANTIFSEVEASRREMVRVREEVEGAREKEFEAIVQLVNRCQSFLQKAIGDPVQAREAASIQANLTLALERLNTLDDKINGKLDSLTAVQ
ncbi:hypothetical protein EDB85DRAFT_804398 [Lactarius pseudohatsudake]|nr:hypothetical protein EDB85DRAFT_804398 [Lactarius pseudohatsudake]